MEDSNSSSSIRISKRLARIIAIGALVFAVLAVSAIAATNHVQGEYNKRDDAFRALAIKTDGERKAHESAIVKLKAANAAALTAAEVKAAKDLKHAVKKQRNKDIRALRRVVRKFKSKNRRDTAAAQSAGYSSGSANGYASGKSDGQSEGYSQGSADAFTYCYYDDGTVC